MNVEDKTSFAAATLYSLEPNDHHSVAQALSESTGWKCNMEELETAQLRDFRKISLGSSSNPSDIGKHILGVLCWILEWN